MMKLKQCQGDQSETAVDKARLNIGRDQTNDIVLDDDMVSGFHACVFHENGTIELVDLGSSNGTWVNDRRITGRVVLKPWDKVRFGSSVLEVIDPAGRRPTTIQPAPSATKISSEGHPHVVATLQPVSKAQGLSAVSITKTLRIGREEANDLVLSDPTVSSRHAEIVVSGTTVEIVDLDSTNGTWVNGKRVSRERLYDGDRVSFDEVAFLVSYSGSPKARANRPQHAAFHPGGTQSENIMSPKSATPDLDFSIPARPHHPKPVSPSTPDFSSEAETSGPKQGPVHHQPRKVNVAFANTTERNLKWLLFSIDGRLGRLNYFISALLIMFVTIILIIIVDVILFGEVVTDPFSSDYGASLLINLIIYIPVIWIHVALAAKRFHDQNRSAHWYWLTLIPLVNIVVIIMLLFVGGTKGTNRFGEEPI